MDPSDPSYGTAVGLGYCIGDRVELHSLKGAAEHNGKHGTVTGLQNERLKVRLDASGGQTLALRPANLARETAPERAQHEAQDERGQQVFISQCGDLLIELDT